MTAGALLGCVAAAAVVLNYPDSPLATRIITPFGELGFILGNVHQGSAVITLSALYFTFGLIGCATGFVLVRVCRR
jgi:hypothetical protein